MAPNGYEIVSNYAAGDAEISLTYVSAVTHTVYNLHSETPLVGKNSSSGSSSNTSYAVNYSTGSGYSPTDIFSMDPGHTFTYTGQPETYTVPAGVHQLSLDAVGGGGGSGVGDSTEPSGAQVTGTLNVTPGEVLTVGVGGMAAPTTSRRPATTTGRTPIAVSHRRAGACRTAQPATPAATASNCRTALRPAVSAAAAPL